MGKQKKERAKLLFALYPKLGEGYSLICKIRAIFKRKICREEAKTRLHEWYDEVCKCTIREIKSARDCIKSKEEEILNYFINRSTNASAESLNSKMKGFRAQLHGIADIPFFLYRVSTIVWIASFYRGAPRKFSPAPKTGVCNNSDQHVESLLLWNKKHPS